MLKNLNITNLGPSEELSFDFGSRLNFLTGDNGLGKSFVLDIIWWTLTGAWPGKSRPMRPEEQNAESARILWSENGQTVNKSSYSSKTQSWMQGGAHSAGLVIYARMDGGFSIHFSRGSKGRPKAPLQLSSEEVWSGSRKGGSSRCEGFFRDVGTWLQTDAHQGYMLRKVAGVLSPQNEPLEFGKPERIYVDDSLNHPVLLMPYGKVPVAEASAGMRRILALAYILTWACHEDGERSRLMKSEPCFDITVIIDEIEAHLHPLWQRTIIPALLEALDDLNRSASHQFHISTHSPLVLASLEPHFDETQDRLFHFKLEKSRAIAEEIEWTPYGASSYWLTSPIFGLGEARSREAETAIQAAKDYMVGKMANLPPTLQNKEQIHEALKSSLPGQDPFWPRWMVKTGLED